MTFTCLHIQTEESPKCIATSVQEKLTNALDQEYVAWPMVLGEWRDYLEVEAAAARCVRLLVLPQ